MCYPRKERRYLRDHKKEDVRYDWNSFSSTLFFVYWKLQNTIKNNFQLGYHGYTSEEREPNYFDRYESDDSNGSQIGSRTLARRHAAFHKSNNNLSKLDACKQTSYNKIIAWFSIWKEMDGCWLRMSSWQKTTKSSRRICGFNQWSTFSFSLVCKDPWKQWRHFTQL